MADFEMVVIHRGDVFRGSPRHAILVVLAPGNDSNSFWLVDFGWAELLGRLAAIRLFLASAAEKHGTTAWCLGHATSLLCRPCGKVRAWQSHGARHPRITCKRRRG